MTSHPFADLSAYIDGAIPPDARRTIDAHLLTCETCRERAAQLRAISSAIAAAPGPRARRSLVPRLARRPVWLAPARTLAAMASGVFTFAFLLSTVMAIDPAMGGGGRGGLLLPTSRDVSGRSQFESGSAAPAVAPAIPQAQPAPQGAAGAAGPAGPTGAGQRITNDSSLNAATSQPKAVAGSSDGRPAAVAGRPLLFGEQPLFWFVLALAFAGLALELRRRMRAL